MVDGSLLPVIAGLAIGIGFVIAFTLVVGNLPPEDVDGCCDEVEDITFNEVIDLGIRDERSADTEVGLFEPDNSGDELNEIDPLAFGDVFDFNFRDKGLTVAVNAVDGRYIGFFSAREIEPTVIAAYPLLQEMIEEADRAGTKELVIIYRNIRGNEAADFLTDGRLAFAQTRLELARYDEVSSFIHFGNDTSYIIRVFEAENGDPFAPDDDSGDETGIFEPEIGVGEPIPVEASSGNETNIEITYNEN
nr:hypothetical protein Josef01_02j05_25 [uncultured archaeon]